MSIIYGGCAMCIMLQLQKALTKKEMSPKRWFQNFNSNFKTIITVQNKIYEIKLHAPILQFYPTMFST